MTQRKSRVDKVVYLRPKQCILAENSCVVCVCVYHQNVKLMLHGGEIASLTAGSKIHLSSYKDCLKEMMCPNPSSVCHLMTQKSPPDERCTSCLDAIRERLQNTFDKNEITSVQFETWIGTDRL